MLYTVIKKNLYQDSVNLMLLSEQLNTRSDVNQISVMMGTPANKDIFKGAGLYTEELGTADPNDLCIVMDIDNKKVKSVIITEIDDYLKNQRAQSSKIMIPHARSWDTSIKKLPNANLAVLSIAGEYVAEEADKALDEGLNVFIFSDNVGIDDEVRLKQKAHERGLIVMGPDCGTGIFSDIPIAFANVVNPGNIGVVGASGTGIQEITSIISRTGGGLTHAIGTGGRDLSSEVGAITTIDGLNLLAQDPHTEVLVYVSKPPAPEVRDKVVKMFTTLAKPVVALFMGEKPAEDHDNVHYTWTLEQAALKAVELANQSLNEDVQSEIGRVKAEPGQRQLKGYFCGGTLALEAAMILRDESRLEDDGNHANGIMFQDNGSEIVDLGDDTFTKNRPHPMIDPTMRIEKVKKAASEPETAIILLDNVIGYGGHVDMAGVFADVIEEEKIKAQEQGKAIIFIASVTGTHKDPQVYEEQVKKLENAGVLVRNSNAAAIQLAITIMEELESSLSPSDEETAVTVDSTPAEKLISEKPRIVNIGLQSFAETVHEQKGEVVQFNWAPVAGGNQRLASLLAKLK
ncbi:acyl-CoA synthetase FdrA [Salicibibacter cibarius]|uniref:Acyl-CoA synthetase FdrA n=1 Tax=Salicibibacter cibarius TaxID=2743000 RepID=A0A7T7CCR7_9BACI|nr:acyl-CoA synthetase FdrA [Salicibibacter cibarius]QQK77223.1 acyl-CoA synthetase FdrA [Salicibibacter cibarius]